jgi:hypothetical protein
MPPIYGQSRGLENVLLSQLGKGILFEERNGTVYEVISAKHDTF